MTEDEEFMLSIFLSLVRTQVDAKKLMMADPLNREVFSDDKIEELSKGFSDTEGDNEYGYAELALQALSSEYTNALERVITVDKARKERRKRIGRYDDIPAIQWKMEGLLVKVLSCEDEIERDKIRQEAYQLQDEIIAAKKSSASWNDFFAANNIADEVRILQDLYLGCLKPRDIVQFLVFEEDDREQVMQEIYRVEKERISQMGVDDYEEVVLGYVLCDDALKEAWGDKALELEMEYIKNSEKK